MFLFLGGPVVRFPPRRAPVASPARIAQALHANTGRARRSYARQADEEHKGRPEASRWNEVHPRVQVRRRAGAGAHATERRDEGVLPLAPRQLREIPGGAPLRGRIVRRVRGDRLRARRRGGGVQSRDGTIRPVPGVVDAQAHGGIRGELQDTSDRAGVRFDVPERQVAVG